jgi:hypothetical protein
MNTMLEPVLAILATLIASVINMAGGPRDRSGNLDPIAASDGSPGSDLLICDQITSRGVRRMR